MGLPACLLHIGAHKTGTTYLQNVFKALTPALRRNGVLYPDRWRDPPSQPGQHRLAERLVVGAPGLDSEMAAVLTADHDIVLISSETLSTLPLSGVERLGQMLRGVDVTIILYCRRWSDLMPSDWQETVRHGSAEPFPRYVQRALRDPEDHPINFGRKLALWAQVFGRDRIRLVSYSGVMDSGQDIAGHFLDTFLPGRAPDRADAAHVIGHSFHAAMPGWLAEVIRALNAVSERHGHRPGSALRDWLMHSYEELDLTPLQHAIAPARRSLQLDDTAGKLRRLHDRLHDAWGDRMVEPHPTGGLFVPRTREVEFYAPARVEIPAIDRRLVELYQIYRSETAPSA